MGVNVFISHAATDSDIATTIQTWIRKTFLGGISVFVSSNGSIAPGDDWQAEICEALKTADMVLVICTDNSLTRPWIGFEAGAAWMRGARVVPVCYHGVTPENLPLPFSAHQALDLERDVDVRRLLDVLVKYGGFDPKFITQHPLQLPTRQVQGKTLPDIRVSIGVYRVGTPGFDDWRLICVVRAANHDTRSIFLSGGCAFELKGTQKRLAVMRGAVYDEPLYARELAPGDAVEIAFDPAVLKPEERARLGRVFFTDKIGRQYYSTIEDVKQALKEWSEGFKRS